MYLVVRKRCGQYKQRWPLPASHAAAIDAATVGCATTVESQLVLDLINDLRSSKCRLLCLCNEETGRPLAELIACKRGKAAFFRRRLGGSEHQDGCLHHHDPGEIGGDGTSRSEPVTFDDFIVDCDGPESAIFQPTDGDGPPRRNRPRDATLHRSRASLAALQTLCLEASGFDVLLETDPALRLPLRGGFPADRIRDGLAVHRATDKPRSSIADVLLVDPPSLKNLVGQVGAHVRKHCRDERRLVGYSLVVVDSISLDRATATTLVAYRRGERHFEVSLPCVVAVTNEWVLPAAGPYLLALRVAAANGAATHVAGYARQVVSRRQLTPLDASSERQSAYDLVQWARSRAKCGVHLSVQRPLRIKIGPLGHAYIADFEVTCRLPTGQFVAFIEVHGVGGGAYWHSKLTTQAEMRALGTVIPDDRSAAASASACPRLWKKLDDWLQWCLSKVYRGKGDAWQDSAHEFGVQDDAGIPD